MLKSSLVIVSWMGAALISTSILPLQQEAWIGGVHFDALNSERFPRPTCASCSLDPNGYLEKEEVFKNDCPVMPWDAERDLFRFGCFRYQCANGVYYDRSVSEFDSCTSQPQQYNNCPGPVGCTK